MLYIHVCLVNTLHAPICYEVCLLLSRRCPWRTSTPRSEPLRTWRISWAGLCWCWTYRRPASPRSLRPWCENYWRRRRCLPRPHWRRPATPSSPRIPVRITPQTAGDNVYRTTTLPSNGSSSFLNKSLPVFKNLQNARRSLTLYTVL